MDNSSCIGYRQSNSFSKLFLDYVEENPTLQPFYKYSANINSLGSVIKDRALNEVNRDLLVERLLDQYNNISNSSKVTNNILSIKEKKTFTITTGHQLSLFTGEWYFIFKIMTAIEMAKEAKKLYPEYHFVPVFWMASEDHDFEEINHINLGEHQFVWKENSGGPTGRIKVDQVAPIINSLKHFIGDKPHTEEIIQLLSNAYQKGDTLSFATRKLVHELFKDEGLVIIDADDVELKKSFSKIISKELFEQKSFIACNKKTEDLTALNYPSQINPREINMFYILDGYRERIISENDLFKTTDGKYIFDKKGIEEELEKHPERFSPNVVLRPLYQEYILPNLSYIGGPGEIAYWLQLKSVFELYNINYPMLAWRNSFLITEENVIKKWNDMGNSTVDLFKSINELEDDFVKKHQTEKINLSEETELLKSYIHSLTQKAIKVDDNLKYSLSGTEKRILRMMERVEHKIWKAEKRKHKSSLDKISSIKSHYFPKGKLQERHDNFSLWFANYGFKGLLRLQNEVQVLSKSIKISGF